MMMMMMMMMMVTVVVNAGHGRSENVRITNIKMIPLMITETVASRPHFILRLFESLFAGKCLHCVQREEASPEHGIRKNYECVSYRI